MSKRMQLTDRSTTPMWVQQRVQRRAFSTRAWVAGCVQLPMVLVLAVVARSAGAANYDETVLDPAALVQLEQRADHADIREQLYLYTDVLHRLTELEGRQVATGAGEQAATTLRQINAVAAKAHAAAGQNAKRLKNAEELLQHTTRRLSDILHVASSEERSSLQATLQGLNSLHDRCLALVFAN